MTQEKSKIAIVSFSLGLVSLAFLFIIIPLMVRVQSLTDYSGVGMILGVFSGVWGMILGLWGILECTVKKKKNIIFAILGLVTSLLSLGIYGFLTIAIATFS